MSLTFLLDTHRGVELPVELLVVLCVCLALVYIAQRFPKAVVPIYTPTKSL